VCNGNSKPYAKFDNETSQLLFLDAQKMPFSGDVKGHSNNMWHCSNPDPMWHFTFKNNVFKGVNCEMNKKEYDFLKPNNLALKHG